MSPPGDLLARLDAAGAVLSARAPGFVPDVALVLGSGLGGAAAMLERATVVPMGEVPHVGVPAVSGHAGRFVLGSVGATRVAALQGRLHTYEGWTAEETVFPLRVLLRLGAGVALLTNAAGGVRPGLRPGGFLVVTDHLNLSGRSPLTGPNEPALGPRFPDLSRTYDAELRDRLHAAGRATGVPLEEGVYAMMAGPAYETPAEIRMLRTLGADAVGMSTVPEAVAAVHMGARVACLSCITNAAAGVTGAPLSHAEVEATARSAEADGVRLLRAFLEALPRARPRDET